MDNPPINEDANRRLCELRESIVDADWDAAEDHCDWFTSRLSQRNEFDTAVILELMRYARLISIIRRDAPRRTLAVSDEADEVADEYPCVEQLPNGDAIRHRLYELRQLIVEARWDIAEGRCDWFEGFLMMHPSESDRWFFAEYDALKRLIENRLTTTADDKIGDDEPRDIEEKDPDEFSDEPKDDGDAEFDDREANWYEHEWGGPDN